MAAAVLPMKNQRYVLGLVLAVAAPAVLIGCTGSSAETIAKTTTTSTSTSGSTGTGGAAGGGGQTNVGGNHGSGGNGAALPWECQPRVADNPRDLLDTDALKAMSLDALGWTTISDETDPSGVRIIVGNWSPGAFCTFDSKGNPTNITLQSAAELYVPPGYPNVSAAGYGKGVVAARHVATAIDGKDARYLEIALQLGVPVLAHGEHAEDWKSLGFSGRDELIGASFSNAMELNSCEPKDFVTGNFALALGRTNVAAITLLTRLSESVGGQIDKVVLRGGSKEGYATWLASAVDDRIAVAGPGGYHLEDVSGFDEYEHQSGCSGSGAGSADTVALLTLRDWARESPGGQAFNTALMVSEFEHLLYPSFLMVAGDTAMPDMHDGVFFRLGAETQFLEGFEDHDWRYDRQPNKTREDSTKMQGRRLALLTTKLIEGAQMTWPKVLDASAQDNSTTVVVSAKVDGAVDVRLWWNHSDNQQWNEEQQADWQSVAMSYVAQDDSWVAPAISPPSGSEIAWYVEAEISKSIGSVKLDARDASPVRFLRELEHLSCDQVPPIQCD